MASYLFKIKIKKLILTERKYSIHQDSVIMNFFADLHVHSKFSRATSADCNLEQLSLWSQRKGIAVVGTGDFTHPVWLAEIKEKLVSAEPGLFRLKSDLEEKTAGLLFPLCRNPVRFILQVEVSTIYKKGEKTRKVHHVILVPDFEKADKIAQSLSRIGNIKSDGRPILGLDSRDLLEIVLESGEGSYLIPAHIWTPWFSALGSNSGFDTMDECYADLAPHIFALETGLSSDPPMNWRLSNLDRYRLVSNSDAHSPSKLGREACVFNTPLDFFAMRRALETGEEYGGTIEFFPEEGKYHLDGHRKCGVRLSPEETRRNSGQCPVCGKPVTVGVMNRVHELADRPEGARPKNAASFSSFVPLKEILSEILRAGPESKRVIKPYEDLIAHLGPELFILDRAPLDDIRRTGLPVLAEAIHRMRMAQVIREAGYDGEYGVIRFFHEGELERMAERSLVFNFAEGDPVRQASRIVIPDWDGRDGVSPSVVGGQYARPPSLVGNPDSSVCGGLDSRLPRRPDKSGQVATCLTTWRGNDTPTSFQAMKTNPPCLDPEQQSAVEITEGPLLIIAGPGAGKTRTLTHRMARLIIEGGVLPDQCLAITFTNRAANEMRERLQKLVPDKAASIPVMTFHALGLLMLKEQANYSGLPAQFRVAGDEERERLLMEALKISNRKARRLLAEISKYKRTQAAPAGAEDIAGSLKIYEQEMRRRAIIDFDDLIALPIKILEARPDIAASYRNRYRWISVDEYQDIDQEQYRLLKLLAPANGNLCVIGDPDQAIYGFRGGDVAIFNRFQDDFPGARIIQLKRNYRSGKMIVQASWQVMAPASLVKDRIMQPLSDDAAKIVIHESVSEAAEAEFIVHTIEQLIGGATFFSMDSGRVSTAAEKSYSFADFAMLCRTDAQSEPLRVALARSGMPFRKCSHICIADSPLALKIAEIMHRNFHSGRAGQHVTPACNACGVDTAGRPFNSVGQGGPTLPLSVVQCLDNAVKELEEAERKEALMLAKALRPLAERSADIANFLSELAIGVEVDLWDPRADCISLLTLHASKGLEFPVVFMPGCEDGLLPLRWGNSDADNIDEERRLFFVGMTRAKDQLFLCHAKRRRWMGVIKEMAPSPFLHDIEEQLLERSRASFRKKKTAGAEQLTLF